ncbi:peptidase family M48-domain-containing protein [Xylariomycetidae sp. FL2044]|nr:peptidase family M48-domain-containing protein [Xylariomycetidae sp. FL2044]
MMQSLRVFRPLRRPLCTISIHQASPVRRPSQIIHLIPNHAFSQTPLRRTNRGSWSRPPHRPEDYIDHPDYHLSRAKPLVSPGKLGRFVRSPNLKAVVILSALGAAAFYFTNIQTVPVSGRRRFNCFSEESVEAASEAQVKRLIWEVEHQGGRFLPDWDPRTRLVKRVMARLIPVSGLEDDKWEVWVIDDPHTANAFVLPGGKVFVYSGIINIARTEDGLAAVLGHEIAHNLAEHVGERMSSQIGVNILLYSLIFLTGGLAIMGTSFIGGSLLDLLFSRPMGRRQESEADYIGLMMMAEACYDPREAVRFWQRMERSTADATPEWISTHPSNHNRIQNLKEAMPKALEKAQQSDCQGTSAFADRFRKALHRGFLVH